MLVPFGIVALVLIIGAASQKKVQAAPCLNAGAAPPAPKGVPINQNAIIVRNSVNRGAPQAQIEASQNSQPKYSDFQASVIAGVGADAAEITVEGLFA